MPGKNEFTPDRWQAFGHVPLSPDDAVECGWTRAGAAALIAAVFPDRAGITLAEARAALDGAGANGSGDARRAAQLVEEVLAYRAERAEVAGAHQAIRLAKVNLKKLLKSPDVTVAQLRTLAQDLGWNVREDEEGVTVPVNELIPFFRRPVVRDLLAAKMRQVRLGPAAEPQP